MFGTDPEVCHILLARGVGISAKHCGLFVDQQLRLYLRDFSRYGTAIRCNQQNGNQIRKDHKWVLTRFVNQEQLFNNIVITIRNLHIQVDFPNHDSTLFQYEKNLRTFLALLEEDADSLAALRIDSVATTLAPSGTATPRPADIYYQLDLLGRGGFASVYQASQAQSGNVFAMKVFPHPADKRRRDSQQPKWLENVQREFSLMLNHRHPNVVDVFALQEREDSLAIVMEFYSDGNIDDLRLHESAYMSAAGQLLDGLQYLHNHGLAHRDLKPENILVRLHPFKVVIADFGLSKIATSPDSLKSFCGTSSYAAPEVFQRRGHGTKADMWSWGVVVYEWMYKAPRKPKVPRNERDLPSWAATWSGLLRAALDDQDDCKLVTLLSHTMVESLEQRWTAQACLKFGFDDPPLFKRREHDNVVVCIDADENTSVLRCGDSSHENSELSLSPSPQSAETIVLPNSQAPIMTEESALKLGPRRQIHDASTIKSHLSSRSIMYSGDLVYMVIQQQRVSMRQSSHDLNASEILTTAKVSQRDRKHYLRIFQNFNIGTRDGEACWVPFADGVYLCHAVGAFDTLRPLLLWPGKDLSPLNDNYLLQKRRQKPIALPQGFASLACGEHEVVYKPGERLINARHLVNLSGHPPSRLSQFLAHHTGECIGYGGHAKVQGTYIPFALAQQLCEHLGLSLHQPIQDLLGPAVDTLTSVNRDGGSGVHVEGGLSEPCPSEEIGVADDGGRNSQASNDGVVSYFWSPSFQAFLGLTDTAADANFDVE